MRALRSRIILAFAVTAALTWTFGCGSSSPSNSNSGGGGGGGTTNNVQPISVNGGPEEEIPDGAFTSVMVCTPGTSTCQTISGILIDTGSSGLRIMSSALSINLTQQTSGGNPITECAQFAGGTLWGPVQTADVKIAGEAASSMQIQVIGSASFPTVPGDCPGMTMDTVQEFGANGLLGIGQSIPDCGAVCASVTPGAYYDCPTAQTCADTAESIAEQVQNPVASFATDNNGTIIELASVSTPAATLNGSLIFGIGTQSNNGLGGATVFGTDDFGDFNIAYSGTTYPGFLDSGSNGLYFLDMATTGLPVCTNVNYNYLYCPTSNQTIPIVITAQSGTNGASASASFVVGDANVLLNNGISDNAAVNDLAGPLSGMVDLGLPFFFGRNVFTAIEGKSTPGGTGPYSAY